MKKFLFYIFIIINVNILNSDFVFSANEFFRSISTGNWNSTSTWEMSTNGGGTWFAATSTPTDTSGVITVRSPNTVTVTANVSADQLVINSGGTISIDVGIFLSIKDGSGTDLLLNTGGTIAGAGSVQTQGANVVLDIKNGSSFNAALKVDSGKTTAFDSGGPFIATINGDITVDAGDTLLGPNGGYTILAKGSVFNSGTISGAGGSSFTMRGPNLINTGSIRINNLKFDSTTTLMGSGSYTSNTISINASGNVSLANAVDFAPISTFTINTDGILNIAPVFIFKSGTFILQPGASVLGTGSFWTMDTVTLNVRGGSNFQAPLKINSGVTTLLDQSGPFNAPIYGVLTVDAGAVLLGGNGGYTIIAYNNVINNGTIAGPGSTAFSMRGPSLLNNGSITINNFRFDSTTALSGTGSYSSLNSFINSSGNVSLTNDVTYTPGSSFTINSGGILNLNGNIFTLSSGTFLVNPSGTVANPGTFRTQDTVTVHIRNGANFNCALLVNSGLTRLFDPSGPFDATLNGMVTVDAGAILEGGNGGYTIIAKSNVTNNGTIRGSSNTTFIMRGPQMINNNLVSITNMHFDSTTTLSGTGTYTSPAMVINGSGNVSLTSNMIFSPGSSFVINTGGILNLNSNTLFFTSGILTLHNGATILNSGLIQTQGAVTLDIRLTANFNVPLKIHSGTAIVYSAAGPFTASLNSPVTIDSGATMNANSGGYTLNVNNDLTNNGIITGTVTAMRFFGTSLINNGSIIINVFNFETGAHTLQGTGSWGTLGRFLTGSVTTLLSTHQMRDININSGATFDITSRKLLLSGAGTPITNNGTFITAGSTIEYNGTAAQAAAAANVTYHSLTINNSAGVSLTSARTVPGILTLTLGIFTNGVNLTLGNGATIVRQDGSLSAVPTFGTSVNVIYIGTNATNTSFELPASPTVLRNLTINNSGGVTLTAARTVNDTLFLISGTFTTGGNLTMADGITINRGTGTFASLPVFPANVNVVYSGTASVSTGIELPVSLTTLKKLTVNNVGGVILTSSITVNDTLRIIKGHLDLNGNIITLSATGYLTETDSNTIDGSTGYIVAVRTLNAPTSLNVAGLGAVISTAANMGSTEIRRGHTIQTDSGTQSIERYYDILPTNNTGLNATFVFKYDETELNGNDEDNLVLFRSTNTGINWTMIGSSPHPSENEVIATSINAFSRWTAGDSVTSLPVELASFTSNISQRDVSLNWSTSQEINNSGFEIERSIVKGQTSSVWSKIAFVEGNGTTSSPKNYSFTERNLNSGKYNYRLKQIDFNGNFEYFDLDNEVVISIPGDFKLSQNYPNPFNPTTKIDYEIPENGNVNITIFDMSGREISVVVNETQQQAGYYTIQFSASNLASGTYFYKIVVNGNSKQFIQTKKMTILK